MGYPGAEIPSNMPNQLWIKGRLVPEDTYEHISLQRDPATGLVEQVDLKTYDLKTDSFNPTLDPVEFPHQVAEKLHNPNFVVAESEFLSMFEERDSRPFVFLGPPSQDKPYYDYQGLNVDVVMKRPSAGEKDISITTSQQMEEAGIFEYVVENAGFIRRFKVEELICAIRNLEASTVTFWWVDQNGLDQSNTYLTDQGPTKRAFIYPQYLSESDIIFKPHG